MDREQNCKGFKSHFCWFPAGHKLQLLLYSEISCQDGTITLLIIYTDQNKFIPTIMF